MSEPQEPQQPGDDDEPFDFDAAFERSARKPCRVRAINVKGLKRTKLSVVERELKRITEERTLEEIRDAALRACAELLALDIFDGVDIKLDAGGQGSDTCIVNATFAEASRLRLHAGTYMQGTEGSVDASIHLNNPLGYAEQVSLGAELGTSATNIYTLALTKPKPWGAPLLLDARVHQLGHNYSTWSSYCELVRGGALTISSEDGTHAVSYELGWRRLTDPGRTASRAVLGQLGDSLLSAVKYVQRGNTFDNAAFPTQGWGYRSETQLAGLGPDANLLRFFRQHVAGKLAVPLSPSGGTTLTLAGEAGVLLPWGAKAWQRATPISDRFFLGGLSGGALRGFQQKGVGPSDPRRRASEVGSSEEPSPRPATKRDALGGDLYCSLMAAVNFQLPWEAARQAGLHGHVFLNGGNLVPLSGGGRTFQQACHEFATTFRWSVGAGIVWPTQVGKLEVNVCKVLARQPFDRPRVGLEFGFVPPSW